MKTLKISFRICIQDCVKPKTIFWKCDFQKIFYQIRICWKFETLSKFFFTQISKWWVKSISRSLFEKFFEATQAEELSLKFFLEASFSKNFGPSKTLENSPGQILQNLAPKTGPSRQIDDSLHNVASDFQFVQRFRK